MIGIYKIQSRLNNKCYVGKTNNIDKRKVQHFSTLKAGKHHNTKLQRFYNKYGEDSLFFDVIEECNECELNSREVYWIDALMAMGHGFNLTYGGETNPMDNPENRKKVSDMLKGHVKSKEWIEKIIKNRGNKMFDTKVKNGKIKYIYAYDVKEFILIHKCYGFMAMADYLGINESNIRQVIGGKMKTARGVHFSLNELTKDEVKSSIIYKYKTDDFKKQASIKYSGSGNGMYGKSHSVEVKNKMRDNMTGKPGNNKRIADSSVIDLYLNENKTQLDISKLLNCTQVTVSTILIKNGIRKFSKRKAELALF